MSDIEVIISVKKLVALLDYGSVKPTPPMWQV